MFYISISLYYRKIKNPNIFLVFFIIKSLFIIEKKNNKIDEFQKIDDIVLENSITSILNAYGKVKK